MALTVGEVALIAAGIGLASPFIAHWTTTRLDRERWIRQQRSEVYVDMLAVYGRMARKASHQEEQYTPLSPEEWRLLQARIEAFTSDRVFAFRDRYLSAWNRFMNALEEVDEPDELSTPEQLLTQKSIANDHALAVAQLYDDIRAAIRRELRAKSVSRRP